MTSIWQVVEAELNIQNPSSSIHCKHAHLMHARQLRVEVLHLTSEPTLYKLRQIIDDLSMTWKFLVNFSSIWEGAHHTLKA